MKRFKLTSPLMYTLPCMRCHMRSLSTKLLMVVLVTILMMGGIAGCSSDQKLGMEMFANLSIRYSVTSNGTSFDVDDVTLDFYYGLGSTSYYGLNPFYRTDPASYFCHFALTFYDGQYYSENSPKVENDYHDLEGYYFIRTLSHDVFTSDDYFCWYEWSFKSLSKQIVFNHHEMLTVPREVFERGCGSFVFQLSEIWFSPKANCYGIVRENYISINYEYIDEQSISLSKPNSYILR